MYSSGAEDEVIISHPSDRQQKLIEAHLAADEFWCPEAFDLSFWGMKGDLDSKLLTVDYDAATDE